MTSRIIDLKNLDKKAVDASTVSIKSDSTPRVRIASGVKPNK